MTEALILLHLVMNAFVCGFLACLMVGPDM